MASAPTWSLHSAHYAVSWHGFASEAHAWRFLFGRDVDQDELDDSRAIGWEVDQCREHPRDRRIAA